MKFVTFNFTGILLCDYDDVSSNCFESPETSTEQLSVIQFVSVLTFPCIFVGTVVAVFTNCYFKRKKLNQSTAAQL